MSGFFVYDAVARLNGDDDKEIASDHVLVNLKGKELVLTIVDEDGPERLEIMGMGMSYRLELSALPRSGNVLSIDYSERGT